MHGLVVGEGGDLGVEQVEAGGDVAVGGVVRVEQEG